MVAVLRRRACALACIQTERGFGIRFGTATGCLRLGLAFPIAISLADIPARDSSMPVAACSRFMVRGEGRGLLL
jgi:hypothetical protein